MRKFGRDLLTAIGTACTLGIVQALVETIVIAALYSNYLLPPAAFFNARIYDAYLKLYQALSTFVTLPAPLNHFIGQGYVDKLAIARDLLWVNVAVGALLGIVIAVFVVLPIRRWSPDRLAPALIVGLVTFEAVVHVAAWASAVHLPTDPTAMQVIRNLVRNFVFDGTAAAVGLLAVSAPIALALVRALEARALVAAAATAALVAGAWALATTPSAHATAASELRAASAGSAATVAEPVATGASATAGSNTANPAAGYNVVLISIDSLRADHLGAYGYPKATSPTMDRLAAEGVLFRRNSSTTAWTLPGHMSLLTGRSLLGHGVVSDDRKLTDDVPLLAESMAAAGYATGAIVSAPYLEARYGFSRGFDHYDDQTINFATHGESYKHVTAPLLISTAEKWLEANASKRFFLFLHAWDVHYDYAPGPPYDTMFDPDYEGSINGDNFYFNPAVNRNMDPRDLAHVLALYDGEIRLVDDHIAALRRALERLGVAGRTAVFITADHGDEFFEHGRKGHHRTLYDEILRVPFLMYVPGVRPTTPVVDVETSIIDIAPTILGLTGVSIPETMEGMDLTPVVLRGEAPPERAILSELYRKDALNVQTSLRRTGRKVIHHFNRRIIEAYELAKDPAEARPLDFNRGLAPAMIADMSEVLNALWPVYQARIARSGVNELAMDAETRERLRSLGYIQ